MDDGIAVRKDEGYFTVLENNEELCKVPDNVEITIEDEYKDYNSNTIAMKSVLSTNLKEFVPPHFGVTILGCSHGFDPKGSTTGFIIWINKR